jgi:preprotein translocase subunit SecE
MKKPASRQPEQKSRVRFGFVRNIIAELKKVVWPTRREATYLTMMVLVVAVTIGVILGVIDFGFSELIDRIFLGQ